MISMMKVLSWNYYMGMSLNQLVESGFTCLPVEVLIHCYAIELRMNYHFILSTFHFLLTMPAVGNMFYDGHQRTQKGTTDQPPSIRENLLA